MHDHVEEMQDGGDELQPHVPGGPGGLLDAQGVVTPGLVLAVGAAGAPAVEDDEVEEGDEAEDEEDEVADDEGAGAQARDLAGGVGEGDHLGHGVDDA